jgi:hypothetical protein
MDIISTNTVIAAEKTASPIDDWEFIRLQDKKPGDIPEEYEAELTRGDVVDIFASIFGRGACGSADDTDNYSGPVEGETPTKSAEKYLNDKYTGVSGAQQLAAEFGLGDLCRPDTIIDGGEIQQPVYLHASSDSIFDDYTIVSYDAKLSKYSLLEHDIYARIEFSNTSFSPLYYYVDEKKLKRYLGNQAAYGDVYEWRGSVRDQAGNIVDNPAWVIKNGRVHFPGTWSGILVFKRLPIKYHYYTLTIRGTVDGEATRHYDARVSAKAAGLSAVHLDLSEEVKAEVTKGKCPWLDLDIGINGAGTEIVVECKNCDDDGDPEPEPEPESPPTCDSPITAEEYSEECCGGPLDGCLPPCRSITTTVTGPITGEEPDEYDGETTVITLMPEGGQPCGTLTQTWDGGGGSCCSDYYVLVLIVNNKLKFSGAADWEYFASVTNDNPVALVPAVKIKLKCGALTVKGWEEASGSTRFWQFKFLVYKGTELIKSVDESGPGFPEDDPLELREVYNDTIEILP